MLRHDVAARSSEPNTIALLSCGLSADRVGAIPVATITVVWGSPKARGLLSLTLIQQNLCDREAGSFVASSDGHGGTSVTEAAVLGGITPLATC